MLQTLAMSHPEWSFVLVGPVGEADPSTDVAALQACSNVHLLGSQPYRDLPAWAAHADLALLPLQHNGYTRHMFPMKFFEYLAAGLPVVGTAIPALKSHGDVAWLCDPNPEAFAAAIDQALQGHGPVSALIEYMEANKKDALNAIAAGKWSDAEIDAIEASVAEVLPNYEA